MNQNEALKNQMGGSQLAPATAANDPAKRVDTMLKAMSKQIERALPATGLTPDRFARIALTTIRQNPKLLECTQQSLMAALMQSAQLGLDPGILGHAYLVPFKNTRAGTIECQFQIGYKGMLELVRRSGEVKSISANIIYQNDIYEIEYGLEEKLVHKPNFDVADRGKPIFYYAVARYKDGGYNFVVTSHAQILEHAKKFSKSFYQGKFSGPWATDFDSMALKTVLKNLMKYMPISVDIHRKAAADETIKYDLAEDMTTVAGSDAEGEVIDAEYHVVEEATAGQE